MSELLRKAMQAKSDQLNAVDILGCEPVLTIRDVKVTNAPQQPVWIYYEGDNNRPWKPSKGMIRALVAGWGDDETQWIGRQVQVYCEPSVKYAGEEVGGIRVKAMSHIKSGGIVMPLTLAKSKRVAMKVAALQATVAWYPCDRFQAALPAMASALQSGKMSLPQVVARCQQTGQLTPEQLAQLEQLAPTPEADNDENEVF